ncbi:MAG: DUF2851 family protein, partial [Bacteroidota bacterium]
SPALRLAQLAVLMARYGSWFVAIKEAGSPEELRPLLRVSASSWWDRHYSLGATRPGTDASREAGVRAGGTGESWSRGRTGEEEPIGADGDRMGERTDDGRDRVGGRLGYADEDAVTALPKRIGKQMADSILINTAVPLLFAYGWLRGENALREKAQRWLAMISPEKNALITGWGHQGVYGKQAADTQALLELKTRYCDPKKCLDCAIGHFLLGGGA